MKYIIMSAGQGSRWNNYLDISKQEAIINNENLLERTVRIIRKNVPNANIIIISNNQNHRVKGTTLYSPIYSEYYKSKYAFELINEEITYLYGDTYYEDETIEKIIDSNIKDIMFYGNSKAIIAVKIKDYILFRNAIENYKGNDSIYHAFNNLEESDKISRFYNVGNEFYNINYPQDYEKLLFVKNELNINNKLLCIGIIWNVGMQWEKDIVNEIANRHNIIKIKRIQLKEKYLDFLKGIYSGSISNNTINHKYESMKAFPEEVSVCLFEVENPHFEVQPQKKQIACKEVSELKRLLRSRYKPLVNNSKYDNIIHITDTAIEFIKNYNYLTNANLLDGYENQRYLRRILK